MPLRYLLIFGILFFPSFVFAQVNEQKTIDILLKQIAVTKNDTDKLTLLDSVAYIYKNFNPNEGIKYARQELDLAVKMRSKIAMANANTTLGLNYENNSDYPEALEYFYVALGIFEKTGPRYNVASTYNNIGVVYQAQNNYAKALECYFSAVKIDSEMQNSASMAGDMGNIGTVYMSQHAFAKALEYDLQSLAIFRAMGDSDGVAHNLGNIGNVYKAQNNFKGALDYDLQAIKIFQSEGDSASLALNLGNVGGVYIDIAKNGDKVTYSDFSVAGQTACLDKAVAYLKSSLAISKRIGQMDNIIEFSLGLSVADSMLGNYKEALESYKQYAAAKDSAFSSNDKAKIAQLSLQRELEVRNKQTEIDRLGSDRRRNKDELYLVCIALGLLIVGIILKKIFPQVF